MMDTQRLILFIVFSFSILMLWDAWQRENRPPAPVAQQGAEVPVHAGCGCDGEQPHPLVPLLADPQVAAREEVGEALQQLHESRVHPAQRASPQH